MSATLAVSGISSQQTSGDTGNSSLYQKFTITSYTFTVDHQLGHMNLFTISEVHCKSVLCNEFPLYLSVAGCR